MVFIIFLSANYSDTQTQNNALQTKVDNLQRDNAVQELTIKAQEQQLNQKENKQPEIIIVSENKDWQIFEATAYTSKDEGCNNISYIGMNIEKWSKYFNFCAVDPDVIPLGSIVIVQLNNEEIPFLAVDTEAAIKGKKLDLYINDKIKAFEFGRQNVIVRFMECEE